MAGSEGFRSCRGGQDQAIKPVFEKAGKGAEQPVIPLLRHFVRKAIKRGDIELRQAFEMGRQIMVERDSTRGRDLQGPARRTTLFVRSDPLTTKTAKTCG